MLAGCATWQGEELPAGALLQPEPIMAPKLGDGGIVIADTVYHPAGLAGALGEDEADCKGPGLGIRVEGIAGEEHYRFGADGEPCKPPKILFDGRNAVDSRPPPPSLHIAFADQLGPQPKTAITAPDFQAEILQIGEAFAKTADEFASTGSVPSNTHTMQDKGMELAQTVKRWRILKESEKLLADIRDIDRMSSTDLLKTYQDKILELQARLRETESQKETQALKNAQLQSNVELTRQQYEATGSAWNQKENKLQTEVLELKTRLSEYERYNQKLAKSKQETEEQYRQRIMSMQAELNIQQEKSAQVRKELIMEAAGKIAEAEKLAFAARMAEREAMQREAARKRQESELLLSRAMQLNNGQTVMVPGLSEEIGQIMNPMPIKLENTLLALHVEGKTLQAMMEDVMAQMEKTAGKWNVNWQLAAQNQFLLEETWTLTAEATFGEIIEFITKRVKETHNLDLSFQRFDKVKLIVISDGVNTPSITPEVE